MKNIDYAKLIKDKIKLSDLIGRDINLIKSGSSYKALCPFHEEKTPSFYVDDNKASFNCFGCGKNGDIYTYLMEKHNIDFKEALKMLASMANVSLTTKSFSLKNEEKNREKKYFSIMQHIANFYSNNLQNYLQNNKLDILETKKIDNNTIRKFKIGLSIDTYNLEKYLEKYSISGKELVDLGILKLGENGKRYDLFKNRLMFPIIDRLDRVIGFGGRLINGEGPKYINSWENDFFKKREILYNVNGLKNLTERSRNIFIVEGYTDVIALTKIGKFAVAPLGTSISLEQISILWRYIDEPTVFLDGDKAGQAASKRLLNMVMSEIDVEKSLNFILLSDKEDPEDILNKENGIEKLSHLIENKKSVLEALMIFEKKIDLSSPERLLGYKKRLFNKLNVIKNKEIRGLYKVFLQKKLSIVFSKSMNRTQENFSEVNDSYFLKLSRNKPDNRFVLRRERSIVVAMINNFKLLQDYDEQLAKIHISNEELSKLRDLIIEIISTKQISTSEQLKKSLIEMGLSTLIKKHFSTLDCINYNLVEKYAMENTDIKDAGKALMDLIKIQEKWYTNKNKNLSNNLLKL